MGTNKARVDKSIRKILAGKSIDEAKSSLPQITSTMKSNFIGKEVSEETYQSIVGVVGGKLSKLYALEEDECEEIAHNLLKREQWINEVMELVEDNLNVEMSEILLKSLRIALAETINEEKDERYFIEKLLYRIVFLSLENTMQGALEGLDEGLTIPQIRKEFIEPLADKLFEDDVRENISNLIDGKITLATVNEQIADKLKNFGGF
ncbi:MULTISPECIES: hypothetical protein [Enterococcus]|uniref:Uncharacterized protein n=1 Tax=Enterococcus casseliflavus TaxID=37734 RepID=A0A6N2YAL9_ENTCA|nr:MULTISPECIES: hypothetical protein [unclassified Enterococcus]MDO0895020.1 hypothetical protein [Enterococcus sp. B1E4]MDO0907973.1 hypothetical protein [Enterococcus sp. B2E4]OTO18609.1 hypothetical protein A5878_003225 [Enterococcus sp. 3G6_DIV0642]